MEMKILLFIAFIVVGANCDCCFPPQFEGIQGMSAGEQRNGTGVAWQYNFNVSVDITGGMIALSGDLFYNGKPIKEQILQDFNKKKQYVVVNGQCTATQLQEPQLMKCIPETAKKTMSSYYGLKNKAEFDMYTFMYGKGVSITLSVEQGTCAPMAEHIQTKDGIYDSGYMGLTPGIKDKRVFDVPAACQKPDVKPMALHPLHKKRKARPSIFGGF